MVDCKEERMKSSELSGRAWGVCESALGNVPRIPLIFPAARL